MTKEEKKDEEQYFYLPATGQMVSKSQLQMNSAQPQQRQFTSNQYTVTRQQVPVQTTQIVQQQPVQYIQPVQYVQQQQQPVTIMQAPQSVPSVQYVSVSNQVYHCRVPKLLKMIFRFNRQHMHLLVRCSINKCNIRLLPQSSKILNSMLR